MASIKNISSLVGGGAIDEGLFSLIAKDIENKGFSVRPRALPDKLTNSLRLYQQSVNAKEFQKAGIGRRDKYSQDIYVRKDEIFWITGDNEVEKEWLDWASSLQSYLNRRLFLGLFSFESHFSHYGVGDYYKRHCDAFKGQANRILSIVVYFNLDWSNSDGGELVMYQDEFDKDGIKISPLLGTVVAFLSEEFPHEVLPAKRDRYSIAGWFCVNSSVTKKIDPPL